MKLNLFNTLFTVDAVALALLPKGKWVKVYNIYQN